MIDENYLNELSVAELRSELKHALEVKYGILDALRDVPLFPSAFILKHLGTMGRFPQDWERGKELQREHGPEVIPYKTECEMGAALWERIRGALQQRQDGNNQCLP